MDVIKRASFASKQVKTGPAPLASFEDLPSDELESPEEIPIVRTNVIDSQLESAENNDLSGNPDSLTISSHSTPLIDSDFDSHCTLTPGDPFEGQSSDLRTASLSSLTKEDAATLCVKQNKGSVTSLGEYDTVDSENVQRKSSWTDIFRSHNQNSAKNVNQPPQCDIIPEDKIAKKKTRNELSKKDCAETKSKDKGKFLSIFKVGKKSSKNIESLISPDNFISSQDRNGTDSLNTLNDEEKCHSLTNGNSSKEVESELPHQVDSCPVVLETQNDLDKLNEQQVKNIPDERKLNRKNFNVHEKEYNILSKQVESENKSIALINENIKPNVIEDESSESEIVFEVKETSLAEEKEEEEEEVDFEAENLLSQDETEEDSTLELRPRVFEPPQQILIPSRQQRLEITTKPIERPRSTTPINVAPLEAFIQSMSPTFDSKVEKIKLSLPGDQFVGRVKSPKKSSVKSWTDFCEKGLHSPRMPKRIDEDDFEDPFSECEEKISHDTISAQMDNKWAMFDSNFQISESSVFGDNFTDANCVLGDTSQTNSNMSDHFEVSFPTSHCSCECHTSGCESCFTSGENVDLKLCSCSCHLQTTIQNEGKAEHNSMMANAKYAAVEKPS